MISLRMLVTLKKQAFRMKRPTKRHKDQRFTTTRGQMLAPILLTHPTKVVAHLLLLLLLAELRVRSEACVAQEQAICLYSLATTQPPFNQYPISMPYPPNATYNVLIEEGMCPGLEPPPQPGLFQQMGQNNAHSAREGSINQAGRIGAAVGASAISLGSQALQRVGGAIRDGAIRTFDWEDGYLMARGGCNG